MAVLRKSEDFNAHDQTVTDFLVDQARVSDACDGADSAAGEEGTHHGPGV